MVEEMLAAQGVGRHEGVRTWAEKFGQEYSNRMRRRLPARGDKWYLDESAPRRLEGGAMI